MDCREPAGFKKQESLGSLVSRNYDSYQGIAKDQTQPFLGLKTDPTLSLSLSCLKTNLNSLLIPLRIPGNPQGYQTNLT